MFDVLRLAEKHNSYWSKVPGKGGIMEEHLKEILLTGASMISTRERWEYLYYLPNPTNGEQILTVCKLCYSANLLIYLYKYLHFFVMTIHLFFTSAKEIVYSVWNGVIFKKNNIWRDDLQMVVRRLHDFGFVNKFYYESLPLKSKLKPPRLDAVVVKKLDSEPFYQPIILYSVVLLIGSIIFCFEYYGTNEK